MDQATHSATSGAAKDKRAPCFSRTLAGVGGRGIVGGGDIIMLEARKRAKRQESKSQVASAETVKPPRGWPPSQLGETDPQKMSEAALNRA